MVDGREGKGHGGRIGGRNSGSGKRRTAVMVEVNAVVVLEVVVEVEAQIVV